jgi:hypothetical protein
MLYCSHMIYSVFVPVFTLPSAKKNPVSCAVLWSACQWCQMAVATAILCG